MGNIARDQGMRLIVNPTGEPFDQVREVMRFHHPRTPDLESASSRRIHGKLQARRVTVAVVDCQRRAVKPGTQIGVQRVLHGAGARDRVAESVETVHEQPSPTDG